MPGSTPPSLHSEFHALLGCLARARCRYLVVGGQALAVAGRPRFTQDLDVLVQPGRANAARVSEALESFGFSDLAAAVRTQFVAPRRMATLGVPPVAVDIMTSITGVSFQRAWLGRVEVTLEDGLRVPFLGVADLIANKLASGRDKDLIDVANLKELLEHDGGAARSKRRPAAPRVRGGATGRGGGRRRRGAGPAMTKVSTPGSTEDHRRPPGRGASGAGGRGRSRAPRRR